jgi:type IV pilus assembly protein PilM
MSEGDRIRGREAPRKGSRAGAGAFGRIAARLSRRLGGGWPELVGVDLGGSSVKVAHLVRRGGRLRRLTTGRRATGPVEGRPADRPELARRALRDLVHELGIPGRPAAVCVLGNEVFVRRLAIPRMAHGDIHSALLLECRKLVNFPIADSELRYQIVGESDGPDASGLELLVSVAHRKRIEEARTALEHAGLKPAAVTIVPVALQTLIREAAAAGPEEVVAYLDMGAGTTHILIVKGDDVRFSREFGGGGAALTEALRGIVVPGRGTVELGVEDAERLKREHGIPLPGDEGSTAEGIPLSAVSIMLRPILERLVRELWNSFDYCNEQYLGEAVSRVVLLGNGSRVRNLPEYLTGVLKIPVARADLAEEIASRAGGPAREAGDAPGSVSELALGLAYLPRASLNFLAPAGAGLPYRLAEAVPQRAAAAVAALLLVSVALPSHVGVVKERQRIAGLRAELQDLAPRADALQRFRAAREEEMRTRDVLARLSGGQVLWSFVLRDLSHRIGPEVRLTDLGVADPDGDGVERGGRSVRLTGLLRTDRRRTEDVLAELMASLQQSPVLDQVRLEGCEAVNASTTTFTVSARLLE